MKHITLTGGRRLSLSVDVNKCLTGLKIILLYYKDSFYFYLTSLIPQTSVQKVFLCIAAFVLQVSL